jgi:transcriptional regulator GlxA family with amidase domain
MRDEAFGPISCRPFFVSAETAPAGRSALQEAQRRIVSNPAADHSVARLAQRRGLSPCHFARLFRQEVGTTPAEYREPYSGRSG